MGAVAADDMQKHEKVGERASFYQSGDSALKSFGPFDGVAWRRAAMNAKIRIW